MEESQKKLFLTLIPNLDTLVIRQGAGTRFFVSAPNTFIIDKFGMLELILGMISVGFFSRKELEDFINGDRKDSNNTD